ncbi:MAG: hypothetical protein ABR583_10940 [Gaiellaceae bacterium]
MNAEIDECSTDSKDAARLAERSRHIVEIWRMSRTPWNFVTAVPV